MLANKLNNKKNNGVNMKKSFLSFFLFVFLVNFSFAQTLQETLDYLTGDAGQSYVAPVISGFGANLNSGWIHRPPKAIKFGVDIEIGFVAMGTFMSDASKTISSQGQFQFSKSQAELLVPSSISGPLRTAVINELVSKKFTVNISGPTITGKKSDSVKVGFTGGAFASGTVNLPSKTITTPVTGFLDDVPIIPLAAPQLSIGTVYGTQAQFRFLPSVKLGDLGEFSYFGFGILHNPGIWLTNPLPVDVSVGFNTQSLKVGDIFKTSATSFGVFASKQFGPGAINITPYAGLMFESSSVDVNYNTTVDVPVTVGGTTTYVPTATGVSFNLKGENTTRFTIGASLKLALLSLSVDYNLAKYNVVSASLTFII